MKLFQKTLSLVLTLLIAMQSMQITIFANYAEIIDILNGNNYDDFIVIDDTVVYSNGDYAFDSSVESDNTPAFAHLLDAQEPTDPVIRIMNLLDIDEATALQMISVFGNAESALEEAELYDTLKRTYYTLNYDSIKDYLTSLVVNGYGAQRVAMSYIVADVLEVDIMDVMVTDYPTDEVDEYTEALVYYYYISPDFIEEYITENEIDSYVLYCVVQAAFKEMFSTASVVNTFSSDDEEEIENPEAPFYSQSGKNEYVSPGTGALIYTLDLASVPGFNGTDINLSLKYDSGKAGLYGKANVTGYGDGGPGYAYSITETVYEEYDWENRSPYVFGAGWRLNYDYISIEDGKQYLNLSDGSRYELTISSSGYSLIGYNKAALTMTADNNTYNDSKHKLTFADGTVEYFDENGNLLAKTDRFGNDITFSLSNISDGTTYTKRLTITNSSGNVVIDYGIYDARITLPNGNAMRFAFSGEDGSYSLSSYTDCEGKVTYFTYQIQESGKKNHSYTYTDSAYGMMTYVYNYERIPHHFLSHITYPTSATTSYTYETHEMFKLSEAAVTSRKDNDGVSDKNAISFTYLRTEAPNIIYNYSDCYYRMNTADYGDHTVEYEINSYGFVTKETTKVEDSVKGWISRTYASCGKPSQITSVETHPNYLTVIGTGEWSDGQGGGGTYPIYDTTSYISRTDSYTYDSKGYVLTSTENGLTKTYTYDAAYHLPLTVTYNQGDGILVEEVYTLSTDKKSVTEKTVYVNDVLSAKTQYIYDARGNVIKERAYKSNSDYVETTYVYDNAGRLTSQATAGVTLNYAYDAMGRVTAETNGIGGTTSYVYDSMGRVTEVKHPDDTESNLSHITTSYTVSNIENSITETDEVGNVTKYNYDALGNIVSVYVGNTLVERYEYDEYSRVSRKFDSQNNYTTYTYDHADRTTAVNVFASGSAVAEYQETYTYEAIATDNLLKTTKTVVGELNAPSIVTLTYTDVYGRVVKEGYNVGTNEHLTIYTYDNLGNKLSELSALDAQNGYVYTNQYVYDYAGRVTRQINALGESAYTEYDWLGNALRKIDNNNNVTTLTYDAFGRVLTQTTPFDITTSTKIVYTYDNVGNVIQEKTLSVSSDSTETLLRKTNYGYDVRGNLLNVMSYHSTDEEGEEQYLTTAVYTYDKKGQMLTSAAGNYVTQYAYDVYGNVSRITYPGGGYETFTYLPNGNLLSSTDRNGVTTTYTYNALGNPLTVTAGTGTNAKTISYTYAKTGAVLSESNSTATTSYTYDAMGRVATEGAAAYTYDLNGNITAVTIGSRVVSYTYDRLNRMTSAVEGNITTVYGYDTNGNRISTVTSVGGTTAAQTTYTYNLAHLATSMTNKNGAGTTLSSFAYTYAADGNILTEVDHTGATTTYTYDLLGRLIAEVGNAGTRFYTYDTAGNRTQAIVDTYTTICYYYNSDGELISETATNVTTSETTLYEYDANGNLTSKSGTAGGDYAYDVWNRMTSADNATYTYNAQGLRVSKNMGNTTTNFLLVGGNVWADSEHNYTRGIELISNGTQLYLYNVRGDVIQLLGFDGEVDKTYDYDAYGNELQRDLNDSNPFRYCGEYYDTETGFIYLRARYYDPMVGRFTSVDPIKDGLNWYSYCDNNPVTRTDKTGEAWETIFDLLSLGGSIAEVCANPDDLWAWGGLVGDALDVAVPFLGGIGETIKALKYANKVMDVADDIVDAADTIHDVAKAADRIEDVADTAHDLNKTVDNATELIDDVSDISKDISKSDILERNRMQGKVYEQQEFAKFSSENTNAVEQVTIKTESGVKTRVDAIGVDSNGNIVINEFKSSSTAPLTKNQKAAFPQILDSGGTVVGKGKGIFNPGYKIPPGTKIMIIRP